MLSPYTVCMLALHRVFSFGNTDRNLQKYEAFRKFLSKKFWAQAGLEMCTLTKYYVATWKAPLSQIHRSLAAGRIKLVLPPYKL